MKRILLTTLQIGITIFLLWWIFKDPTKRTQMAEAVKTAQLLWLIPGILSIGIAIALQTERWRLLLAVQGISMGWMRTLKVYLIGAFFNLFLLGSTGGDIVKIFYAMRETATKKSAALLSVLVDRMIGLVALVAITAVLCSLRLDLLLAHPVTQALLGSVVIIMSGAVGVIIAGFLVDRFHLAHKLPKWLPLHGKIIELSAAFSTYARDPGVLLKCFALSVPAHLMTFLSVYFAALAFGQFAGLAGLFDILSVLPIINTIASLPISLSGVGLREGLFQKVFGALFGTPESVAVMISVTGFLIIVLWGLIGGLVYMAYRPSGGIHLSDMKEEVAEAEESIEKSA